VPPLTRIVRANMSPFYEGMFADDLGERCGVRGLSLTRAQPLPTPHASGGEAARFLFWPLQFRPKNTIATLKREWLWASRLCTMAVRDDAGCDGYPMRPISRRVIVGRSLPKMREFTKVRECCNWIVGG